MQFSLLFAIYMFASRLEKMDQINSHSPILDSLRAEIDATALVRMFNEEYRTIDTYNLKSELAYFHGHCTVTEDYKEHVITPLLADPRSGSWFAIFPHPLFIAMDTRNISIIELLLTAGVSVKSMLKQFTRDTPNRRQPGSEQFDYF